MADEDVEQTTEREPEPGREPSWWRRLAAWGAVALVVLGVSMGAWGYYGWENPYIPVVSSLVAKIVCVGSVVLGGSLLGLLEGSEMGMKDTRDAKEY